MFVQTFLLYLNNAVHVCRLLDVSDAPTLPIPAPGEIPVVTRRYADAIRPRCAAPVFQAGLRVDLFADHAVDAGCPGGSHRVEKPDETSRKAARGTKY